MHYSDVWNNFFSPKPDPSSCLLDACKHNCVWHWRVKQRKSIITSFSFFSHARAERLEFAPVLEKKKKRKKATCNLPQVSPQNYTRNQSKSIASFNVWRASLRQTRRWAVWAKRKRKIIREHVLPVWQAWIKARACKHRSKGQTVTVPAGQFHQSHRVGWAGDQSELLLAMVHFNLSTQIQPCPQGKAWLTACEAQLQVMSFTCNYIASATCVVTGTLHSHMHVHVGCGTSIHQLLTLWGRFLKKKNK